MNIAGVYSQQLTFIIGLRRIFVECTQDPAEILSSSLSLSTFSWEIPDLL